MGAKKNFVIDTNVILHDYNCLKNFQENDVYLPIVVLEELDKFKKGNEQINFNAREFLRELDLITDDNLFTEGASLGEGMGRLFVVAGRVDAPDEGTFHRSALRRLYQRQSSQRRYLREVKRDIRRDCPFSDRQYLLF